MIYQVLASDLPLVVCDLPGFGGFGLWSTYLSRSAEISGLEKKVDHKPKPPKGAKGKTIKRTKGPGKGLAYDLPTPWNLQKERSFEKTCLWSTVFAPPQNQGRS